MCSRNVTIPTSLFNLCHQLIFRRQQYTATRKRSWSQKVLGGRPSLTGYEDLFDESIYRDLGAAQDERNYVPGQKLLSCVEEEETEIRNNTCVLGTSYVAFSFLQGPSG